jgi:hypothetical protein
MTCPENAHARCFTQIGAEIKGFDPKTYFKDKKSALRNDRWVSE